MTTSQRAPKWFAVPVGTKPAECRSCRATIYFVETASGKQMPVHCEVDGGSAPSNVDGLGISHFSDCPAAASFRRPKS